MAKANPEEPEPPPEAAKVNPEEPQVPQDQADTEEPDDNALDLLLQAAGPIGLQSSPILF